MPNKDLSESLKYLAKRPPKSNNNPPPPVFDNNGAITSEFLDRVGRQAGLLYRGDDQLARMQLAREFSVVLSGCKDITELVRRVATLIGYLGHSDFAFIQWDIQEEKDTIWLKRLFGSYPPEIFAYAGALFKTTVEGKPNSHLISRFHLEQQAVFNSCGQYGIQECYVLISRVGNYGFILPNTINRCGGLPVTLSVVSEGLGAEDFRYHVETNQVALNLLANEINMAAIRQFPDLFVSKTDAQNSSDKNLLRH